MPNATFRLSRYALLALSLITALPAWATSKHALLIGIGDYPGPEVNDLKGTTNDIERMRGILKERLQVPQKNTQVLLDGQATHSGIQKAFAELAKQVGPDDFVYIHYSGHGSTYPDLNKDEKQDTFDQTWVSYGARSSAFKGSLDYYDILDDELDAWLQPIYAKTSRIVLVSDSCHSGTVNRGEITGLRAQPIQSALDHPAARNKPIEGLHRPGIHIGASLDTQPAAEVSINGESFGLFTWHWSANLGALKPHDTWQDLFQRTYAQVSSRPGSSQRPQLSGDEMRNTEPVSGEFVAPSKKIPVAGVEAAANSVTLPAGSASGVTQGSVYRLAGAEGDAAAPRVEITQVSAFTSQGKVLQGRLKVGDALEEAEHVYTNPPIKLWLEALRAASPGQTPLPKPDQAILDQIRASLGKLTEYTLAANQGDADLSVYLLRPKLPEGWTPQTHPGLPAYADEGALELWVMSREQHLLAPAFRIPWSDKALTKLAPNLTQYARLTAIKSLDSGSSALPLDIRVTHWTPTDNCEGKAPDRCHPWKDFGIEQPYRVERTLGFSELADAKLPPNAILTFEVTNRDPLKPLYVYLLDIMDDKGKVVAIFPDPTAHQDAARVNPGATRNLASEALFQLTDPGRETIKAIVTEQPIDARLLESDGYRQRSKGADSLSPLERLLGEAMHDGTRGRPIRIQPGSWDSVQAGITVEP